MERAPRRSCRPRPSRRRATGSPTQPTTGFASWMRRAPPPPFAAEPLPEVGPRRACLRSWRTKYERVHAHRRLQLHSKLPRNPFHPAGTIAGPRHLQQGRATATATTIMPPRAPSGRRRRCRLGRRRWHRRPRSMRNSGTNTLPAHRRLRGRLSARRRPDPLQRAISCSPR